MMWLLLLIVLAFVVDNAFALHSLGQRMEALEKTVGTEISAIVARLEQALAKAKE